MNKSTTDALLQIINKRRFSLTEPATLDANSHETSRTNDALSAMLDEMGLPDAIQELIILDTDLEKIVEIFCIDMGQFERDNKADRRYDDLKN